MQAKARDDADGGSFCKPWMKRRIYENVIRIQYAICFESCSKISCVRQHIGCVVGDGGLWLGRMKSRRRRSEWRSGEGRYGPSADVAMPGIEARRRRRNQDKGRRKWTDGEKLGVFSMHSGIDV